MTIFVSLAMAQDAAPEPSAEPLPPEPAPLSADELAAIEAALSADQAAIVPSAPLPPPATSVGGQSMNPDIAFITDVALAGFSSPEPRVLGAHDPQANGFNLQQLELSIGKPVDPYFRVDGNIVFAQFGVEIEEIYATTLALPFRSQVRVGQFLTRFGRINNTHPHSWDFVTQTMAAGRIWGGEGNRGLGVEASMLLPFPWYAELLVSETMAGGEATARSFWGGTDLGVAGPLDLQTTAALKQFHELSPDLSLFWGLSYANGPNPSGQGNRTEVYGGDLYLKWRPVSRPAPPVLAFTGEAYLRRRQVPGDVWQDFDTYAQLAFRAPQRWGGAVRYELGTPTTNLAGEVVNDDLDPEWIELRQRVSANVTYWPTEFSRLRLEGSRDAAGWDDSPDWAVMLAMEFNIGAHGAHSF